MMKLFLILVGFMRLVNGVRNGQDAFIPHPWYVQIYDINDLPCGGAILNREWVITAAHCVENLQSVYLGIGCRKYKECKTFMTAKEVHIIQSYDVALIKLPIRLKTSYEIRPIKLVPKTEFNRDYKGETATACGHGTIDDEYPTATSSHLQCADFIVIDNQRCKDAFFTSLPNLLCVEGFNKKNASMCNGDSGGPLLINDTLVGIATSATVDCKGPSAFTRITPHLDWICEIMLNEQKETYSTFDHLIYFGVPLKVIGILLAFLLCLYIIYKIYKRCQKPLYTPDLENITIIESQPLQQRY